MAACDTVMRQALAEIVDNPELDAVDCASLLLLHVEPLRERVVAMCRQQIADRAERRHLRHPPAMEDEGAELRRKPLAHRTRRGGAADDEPPEDEIAPGVELRFVDAVEEIEPDGRHAEGERDLLAPHQLVEALAVHARAGQYEL